MWASTSALKSSCLRLRRNITAPKADPSRSYLKVTADSSGQTTTAALGMTLSINHCSPARTAGHKGLRYEGERPQTAKTAVCATTMGHACGTSELVPFRKILPLRTHSKTRDVCAIRTFPPFPRHLSLATNH